MTPALVAAALACAAVAVWPRRGGAVLPPRSHGSLARRVGSGVAGRSRWAVWRRPAGRPRPPRDGDVAEAAELLVPALQAGATPARALRVTVNALGPRHPMHARLRRLADAAAAGLPVSALWLEGEGGRAAPPGAALIGRVWDLSEETGSPLAPAVSTAAKVLRHQESARRRLAAAAAGPRASMTLLALLPLSGPVVGAAVGIPPEELYLRSPATQVSLLVGLVLGVTGWCWSRAILHRALLPEEVR